MAPTIIPGRLSRSFLPLLLALLPIAIGCGSASTVRNNAPAPDARLAVPDSTGLANLEKMRRVEREPLTAEAPDLRREAFEWVVSSPDLGGFEADASWVGELDRGNYPFKGEMMMQFVFGMVLWRFSGEVTSGDKIAQVEGGFRSMIAAYRNILLADKNLRDPWLNQLDEIRRTGKLRAYIEEIEGRR
jgi:hypothetical protein